MVKRVWKMANKSYKIVVIAHNKVKRVPINIMIVKDIRFDPIWRYVIPCHFHWPLYENSKKEEKYSNSGNSSPTTMTKTTTTKITANCKLFMRNKCSRINGQTFHFEWHTQIHSHIAHKTKHKQDIFFCILLHLKRINALQRSVVNFDEVGCFLFIWHKRKKKSWLTNSTVFTLWIPTAVPIFVCDACFFLRSGS